MLLSNILDEDIKRELNLFRTQLKDTLRCVLIQMPIFMKKYLLEFVQRDIHQYIDNV